MVLVFTRTFDNAVLDLIRKLDRAAANSRAKGLVSVVVMSEDKMIAERLQGIIKNQKVEAAVLSIWDYPKSAVAWNISEEAEVTVVVFSRRREVAGNFASRKGELDGRTADEVLRVFMSLP